LRGSVISGPVYATSAFRGDFHPSADDGNLRRSGTHGPRPSPERALGRETHRRDRRALHARRNETLTWWALSAAADRFTGARAERSTLHAPGRAIGRSALTTRDRGSRYSPAGCVAAQRPYVDKSSPARRPVVRKHTHAEGPLRRHAWGAPRLRVGQPLGSPRLTSGFRALVGLRLTSVPRGGRGRLAIRLLRRSIGRRRRARASAPRRGGLRVPALPVTTADDHRRSGSSRCWPDSGSWPARCRRRACAWDRRTLRTWPALLHSRVDPAK